MRAVTNGDGWTWAGMPGGGAGAAAARRVCVAGATLRAPGCGQERCRRRAAPGPAAARRALTSRAVAPAAGDNMETPAGEKFIVLREDDILCKA